MEHVNMSDCVNGIAKYLEYIGINNVCYEIKSYRTPIYSMTSMAAIHFEQTGCPVVSFKGKCDYAILNAIKPFIQHYEISRRPIFDEDALYGSIYSQSRPNDFTAFKYIDEVTFEFSVYLHSEASVNDFIFQLKSSTEGLRQKRFNEEMDRQISQELGTKE